jgi:hypothetical protein
MSALLVLLGVWAACLVVAASALVAVMSSQALIRLLRVASGAAHARHAAAGTSS